METNVLDLSRSPYQRFLGLSLLRVEDGLVEIRLPFREEFGRDDNSDWLHGGILSALIDIAGDYAIVTKVGKELPTIDLRVDYLRPGPARRSCRYRKSGEAGQTRCLGGRGSERRIG